MKMVWFMMMVVTTRLDENHYIMTTTTGGAANVLGKLEDYLQTEWPELDVYLSSVTDHYATASICGPNSKKILNKLIPDLDLSDENFPHMSFQKCKNWIILNVELCVLVLQVNIVMKLIFRQTMVKTYGKNVWKQVKNLISLLMVLRQCTY